MCKEDSGFRHPQYLHPGSLNEPSCKIRCPVHGFIHYSRNECKVIDHHIFRRLRWIKQLALTDYLYPGASHSRFEHSLGVMHLATRAFDRLAERHGAQIEEQIRKVAEFKEDTLSKARQVLRLAALCHDLGHAPFSHVAEKVIHKDTGHEELSILVVKEKRFLGGLIDRIFFKGCAEQVANVIEGPDALAPQLQVLKDIVSGEMDADRTDYLLRDSLHCGVEYGSFDHERMIESLRIVEGEGGTLEMALDRGGIHTAEALILARYQMNSQVYYHRTRRIYDYYLSGYFKAKGKEFFPSPESFLEHDDVTMMNEIKNDAKKNDDSAASRNAVRIVNRTHHVEIHVTGETTGAEDIRQSRVVLEKLKDKFKEIDFVWDKTKAKIHKLLLPDDVDEGWIRLPVIDKNSSRPLGMQSHILKKIPKYFQVARIFADVSHDAIDKRKEIVTFAADEYRLQGGN